jgi:hypothetical protein
MPANNEANANGVSSLNYPRTGKRGVPQQFPRRLYEMLQSERKLIAANADHPKIIFWSESGKAFRIADVAEFSTAILPKYFRTKKFSSFQRNLNLYGFAKVRRGPETDMYAHPSFVRDQADSLSELRKLTSTSSRRRTSIVAKPITAKVQVSVTRSVSPSPTLMLATAQFHAPPMARIVAPPSNHMIHKPAPSFPSPQHTSVWAPIHKVPPSPDGSSGKIMVVTDQSSSCKNNNVVVGRGRLDLLALAMEQAAAMMQ